MHKRAAILLALAAILLTGCRDDDEKRLIAWTPPGAEAPIPVPTPPPSAPIPPPPPADTADSATLEWLAPTTTTDGAPLNALVGYRIYYGRDVARMQETIEVRNPGVLTYVVENLSPGTYYFAVTALTATGESKRSNAGRKIIS
jgi:hypothetical protein